MRRTRVKFCGITRVEDALAAVDAGADAIGVIFWSGSSRAISHEHARAIRDSVPASVTVVGVFVDALPGDVTRAVDRVGIDSAQLCGQLRDGDWESVARSTHLIRGLAVRNEAIHGERGPALFRDYLLDNGAVGQHGGTGIPFDWSVSSQVAAWGHLWLAGGLNSQNVGEAIAQVRPHAVDVSTGVEIAPGIKSGERISQFIDAVHHADHALAKLVKP